MVRASTALAGLVGGAVAVAGGWSLYQRYTTEQVPYTVVARVGDAELRRYPATVLVETVADSQREAFGRLFRYIDGHNAGDAGISMTAPVATDRGTEVSMTAPVEVGPGTDVSMTAPVERGRDGDGVRMAFYLPAEYDLESAPQPLDESVSLVVVPERTLAVRRFSWRATAERVGRETERLLETLSSADVETTDEPFYMGYDAPWTLPFLRRNEVAVEVAR
ncbi:SOUL family heme-binding protein [Halosegnis marinus]|uniref:SOUL family heme-binding protein n=1 Tax=Halosegnis marinus TaxID=3034023 RepID=A0ABD5ZLI5_9EURY|nr:heme-binding protein [Halosegnis sp. DT85]